VRREIFRAKGSFAGAAMRIFPLLALGSAMGLAAPRVSPPLTGVTTGLTASHACRVPPGERDACAPSAATVEAAAGLLQTNGFVALRADGSLLAPHLVDSAREQAREDLGAMLDRLRRQGLDPDTASFSFAEVVHRSARRYDLKLDRRRMPPTSPWNSLSAAAASWAVPILQACGVQESLKSAVEGVLTSLPGGKRGRKTNTHGCCGRVPHKPFASAR
jgi:hypothetical protein